MDKKYYIEGTNSQAPQPVGPSSAANRVPIDSITPKEDGNHDIHIKFQGKMKKIPFNQTGGLNQYQRALVFRNQYGIQVPASEVLKSFSKETQ